MKITKKSPTVLDYECARRGNFGIVESLEQSLLREFCITHFSKSLNPRRGPSVVKNFGFSGILRPSVDHLTLVVSGK